VDAPRAASFGATAGIASSRQVELGRSVAVDGTASINVSGQVNDEVLVVERGASVAATAAVEADAVRFSVLERQASASAEAVAAVAHMRALNRSVAATASGSVEAVPQRYLSRSVLVPADARVTVAGQVEEGFVVIERFAAIDGTAAITSSGAWHHNLERGASLAATADAAAAGVCWSVASGAVGFGASGAVEGTSHAVRPRRIHLQGTGLVVTISQRELVRLVSLSAAGDVQATAVLHGIVGIGRGGQGPKVLYEDPGVGLDDDEGAIHGTSRSGEGRIADGREGKILT
jgi:hypothetical protein